MLQPIQFCLLMAFPAAAIAAALCDAASYTIPNWLTGLTALAFFPAALALGLPPAHFALALGIGVAALAAGAGMFAFGWIGGGDAKLFAACALWLGWPAVLPFLATTALAGGALAVSLLGLRKLPMPAGVKGPGWAGRLLQPGGDVPYGVAIAVGALAAFPQSGLAHLAGLTI